MKRVFIVHGRGSSPKEDWFPWIARELKKKGFTVKVLKMPNTDRPQIAPWVAHLKRSVGEPDEKTHFIGHSIGCQTIMRYLEGVDRPVGNLVLVGAWFTLKGLEKEEKPIAQPWLTKRIDTAAVRKSAEGIGVILSDDDPFVPLNANRKAFANRLGARVTVLKNKGHIDGNAGVTRLPIAVQEIVRMSR